MLRTRSPFLSAFLVLVGTIIGAGVFGVPLVFSRMGLLVGSLAFWGVALLVLASHLLFAEVIARDGKQRRLPGYVGNVLGRWAEHAAVISHSFHLIGSNLAYLILGGEFLAVLTASVLPNVHVIGWQTVFWVGGAVTVLAGIHVMTRVESFMAWIEISSMALIAGLAFFFIKYPVTVSLDWSQATVGLGVFLFALSGLSVMPEVYELTGRRIGLTRRVTIASTALTALLTWLFGIGMYLAAGGRELGTAAEIALILPPGIGWLIPFFGFFAVATSYLTTAFDLRAMCVYDLKWRSSVASLLALGTPFALLFFTTRNFFTTIDVVGAIFSGTNALLITLVAFVLMRRSKKRVPFWWRTLVPLAAAALFLFVILQRVATSGVH
ncbi:MAG: aromatic amino acid transport family protein [Patescibacteria group bacterium]|jgi:amino acid permease